MRPLPLAMFARVVGVIVGIALIYSGTVKVSRPYDFLAAVFQYQMFGPALATFVAGVLPFLELGLPHSAAFARSARRF